MNQGQLETIQARIIRLELVMAAADAIKTVTGTKRINKKILREAWVMVSRWESRRLSMGLPSYWTIK
jgi:hypothetical protein